MNVCISILCFYLNLAFFLHRAQVQYRRREDRKYCFRKVWLTHPPAGSKTRWLLLHCIKGSGGETVVEGTDDAGVMSVARKRTRQWRNELTQDEIQAAPACPLPEPMAYTGPWAGASRLDDEEASDEDEEAAMRRKHVDGSSAKGSPVRGRKPAAKPVEPVKRKRGRPRKVVAAVLSDGTARALPRTAVRAIPRPSAVTSTSVPRVLLVPDAKPVPLMRVRRVPTGATDELAAPSTPAIFASGASGRDRHREFGEREGGGLGVLSALASQSSREQGLAMYTQAQEARTTSVLGLKRSASQTEPQAPAAKRPRPLFNNATTNLAATMAPSQDASMTVVDEAGDVAGRLASSLSVARVPPLPVEPTNSQASQLAASRLGSLVTRLEVGGPVHVSMSLGEAETLPMSQ